MSEELELDYSLKVHKSLTRPTLLMGCDREMFLLLATFAGVLGIFKGLFNTPIRWGNAILGAILWAVGLIVLRLMAKKEPYARAIFTNSLKYHGEYPATTEASEALKMMTPDGKKKKGTPSKSFADLIRYDAQISDTVIVMKDGSMISGFKYTGTDLDAATMLDKHSVCVFANNSIKKLDGNYTINFETVRIPSTTYPTGNFSEAVTKIIDLARKYRCEKMGEQFETETYCFVTWTPMQIENTALFQKLKKFIMGDDSEQVIDEAQLHSFEITFQDFASSFSTVFSVEILKNEKLLSTINLFVNGKHFDCEGLPEIPCDLDCFYAREFVNSTPLIYDDQYVALVSISDFRNSTFPDILSIIGKMPFACRWSTRYVPMDYVEANSFMTFRQKKWAGKKIPMMSVILNKPTSRIDKDAAIQEADISDALISLNDGSLGWGKYTSTIVIRDTDLDSLDNKVNIVIREIEKKQFKAVLEKMNRTDAFIGSFVGHNKENVRKPFINTGNLTHMLMLSSNWAGLIYNPCPFYPAHSPALMHCSSYGKNPFRLHLHTNDVGHTLVIGPTGAGKSTLLAMLVAQFDRYENSQIFVFDKGRSMYPLVTAMENSQFYNLGDEGSPAVCPLAEINEEKELSWAIDYVTTLIKLNGGTLTPEKTKLVTSALKQMATGTTRTNERTLSDLRINIQDEHIKDTLNIYTQDGAYGAFLDGEENNLKYSKVTAFELEELMGRGEKVATPTLLYLFHQIEKRLDGRPTLIVLDEAWVALSTPLFADKLKEWLKVLRKSNAAVVLATQNITDILASDVSSAVLDSCPTKILLPNPEARAENMRRLYQNHFRCNDAEVSTIANAVPKKDYFYISPNGKRLFRMELDDTQLAFVGSSGRDDLREIEKFQNQFGLNWVYYWLQQKGLPDVAEYWAKEIKNKNERVVG